MTASKKGEGWGETIRTIVVAVLIALTVRTLAFEPFTIPSGSMRPTLLVGDYLFVSKFSYGYSYHTLTFGVPLFSGRLLGDEPQRGDVVVFRNPRDTSTDFIKRVIGLPGDRIQMIGGVLHINDRPVERRRIEDFEITNRFGDPVAVPQYIETLPGGVEHRILEVRGDTGFADNTDVYAVPQGHYFMMGDNRDDSTDSRVLSAVGYVPIENIVGRAEVLWFSLEDASFIEIWEWPFALRLSRMFTGID